MSIGCVFEAMVVGVRVVVVSVVVVVVVVVDVISCCDDEDKDEDEDESGKEADCNGACGDNSSWYSPLPWVN